MINKPSSKLILLSLLLFIGIVCLDSNCASSKEIKNDVLRGVSNCDTTKGFCLRNFDAWLKDSLSIWEVSLTKGIRYKFMVFDRNCYRKTIKPKKTVSSFLSIYYCNDNQNIGNENFIGSTSMTDKLANCFIFDCNKSDIYYVTIQPIKGKLMDRTTCSMGMIYFIKKIE